MTAFLPRVACLRQQRRFATKAAGAVSPRAARAASRPSILPAPPPARPILRTPVGGQQSLPERKVDKDGVPVYSLPREKMRALVDLYHEASDFITYDNLDARIDQAFTGKANHYYERKFADLQRDLRHRNEEPDYVRFYRTSLASGDLAGTRLQRVRAALWGTTDGGKPGLEIVEEERDDLDRTLQTQERLEKGRGG